MGKPVMFRTPGGEEMVVLSRVDYENLLAASDPEDEADVAAYDEAMARLASGEDRRLAKGEMDEYLTRPGYLRGLRKGVGLTQAELAAKAGIAQSFLSDIEAGRRNASPETRARLGAMLSAVADAKA